MSAAPIPLLDTRDAGFPRAFARLESRRLERREEVERVAAEIVEDVRRRGDAALLDATERLDGYRLEPAQIRVSDAEIERGAAWLETADRAALREAAERIRRYHALRVPASWSEESQGERLGQRVVPLRAAGLYVPGFKAPLASTVLMLAIPASVAGVRELAVTCPGKEHHPAVLEAVRLCGVGRLYRIGGAQAVAALAYGTESVERVDKIAGPGNVYVQAAKRAVFGQVAIDSEAGPSEVLIVAGSDADPEIVAADLLAQAEHDEMASCVLCTPSEPLARATLAALERQLRDLPRRELASRALRTRGACVVTRDLDEACDLANRYAPEHLQLLLPDAERWLERIQNAGAVFLGPHSPVPLGDYVAGPSHVLPTGGTARFFSVVGVEDFQRRMSVIGFSEGALRRVGPTAERLAELEGLHAHARAVRLRLSRSS